MAVVTHCPHGCELKVPDRYLGKTVRCPKCRVKFSLPPRIDEQISKNKAHRESADRSVPGSPFPIIDVKPNRPSGITRAQPENPMPGDLVKRGEQSRRDRRGMCRYFAALLLLVGWASAFPAAWAWWEWFRGPPAPLPFWILLAWGAGAWPAPFAILLAQIPDWATLKAAAGAMLVSVCGYGMFAAALTLADSPGWLSRGLQLGGDELPRAGMWCLAMMCLAIVASLACYREGRRWQRMEEILAQLLSEKS